MSEEERASDQKSIDFYAKLIRRYLDGRLPIPGWFLKPMLTVLVELQFRFEKELKELPEDWGGGGGAMAEQSEDLMRIHYDKPGVLFENFLGPTMKYTMALWERGAKDLEEAQVQMMDDLCDKAGIQDGDEVLDIACGFGSLSGHILQRYPSAKVTAINLSNTQCDFIEARQSEEGHALHTDRFRLIREDFTKVEPDRQYDRIMVIGLFEHIRNLREALQKIAGFLRLEGTVLLHFITFNRLLTSIANTKQDFFFNRYIFPGGRFWYFPELSRYQEHLKLENSWFLNGKNYKRTLQVWQNNFWRNIEAVRAHPDLDERFIRTWDLYLRLCIAVFGAMGGRDVGNGQYLLRHAQPVA